MEKKKSKRVSILPESKIEELVQRYVKRERDRILTVLARESYNHIAKKMLEGIEYIPQGFSYDRGYVSSKIVRSFLRKVIKDMGVGTDEKTQIEVLFGIYLYWEDYIEYVYIASGGCLLDEELEQYLPPEVKLKRYLDSLPPLL